MKIKRLEIKGFKSFPARTVFEFKPGITGIVGPNGCGKSNVFEAIRWVMGEQRVKSLRGKKMEDVIFNGSDTRKPLGMAEVRLVLSNSGGCAPPSMADYDEIMITRRIFRDGESQYEINNIPCRLLDVTEFFLDTGVGKNSYAIIEQGRVDMVVASKPEDRRVLIEEAAGINRYKARRDVALKKLEHTQQNLLRISDVITEVRRQHNALKRQASRAERYRKTEERLRELDLQRHAHKCSVLQEQHSTMSSQLQAEQSVLSEKETRLSSIHAELERERLRDLQIDKTLKENLESRHRIELELASTRNQIATDRSSVARLAQWRTRSEEEKASLERKKEEARTQHLHLENDQAALREDLARWKTKLQQSVDSFRELEKSLAENKRLQDKLKDDIFRNLQNAAQARNHRQTVERRRTETKSRQERISRESQELAQAVKSDGIRRQELTSRLDVMASQLSQRVQERETLIGERQRNRERIAGLREEIASLERRLAAANARKESLEEMQKSYSAYGEGVRFLMQDEQLLEREALLGPLAEMIDVAPEHQKAVAAALGDRLGHIVVLSPRSGAEAANRLRDAGAGRTTFIPASPRFSHDSDPEEIPPGLTRVKELVRFRRGFEDLGDFLFSRCFVVENISQAIDIWERNGINIDLVTSNGEVLSRYGEITGGSHDNVRDEIFEKKREIAELNRTVTSLEQDILHLRSSLAEKEEALETLAAVLEKTDREINDLKLGEAGLKKDLERLDAETKNSRRRLEVIGVELENLVRESQTLEQELRETEETIVGLEAEHGKMEEDKEQLRIRVEQLAGAVQEKSGESNEIRVLVAQLEERNLSLEKETRFALETLRQMEKQLDSLKQQAERNASEEERLGEEILRAEELEKELMQDHSLLTQQIEALRQDSARASDALKTLEEQAAGLEKSVRELRDQTHRLEMESVRLEQTLDGLVEKILERYQVDPRTIQPPDEPPDEAVITDLRAKLEAMGEVNLAAIAESRLTEERLQFLTEQEDDLRTAVDSLYATINKINRTTKERFREAFDQINEKFREIFPALFKGGEARLELTDEGDLLETGVEIMARPPGKRVRNMDLLSGGEKALTAVALIFSIFLIRPSPFCLLDEVDAPLDDSNIDRFNEMLRKLSHRTQFLVVTHSKRSMEAADTLYGVTMEEPGTSAVVSVEFMS